MCSTAMIFKMPQFEIRNFSENDWKKVPEMEFLIKLTDSFERITPVLSEMFQGKEIFTRDFIYRIKNNSN